MLLALLLLVVLVGCDSVAIEPSQSSSVSVARKDGGYLISESGEPVLFYRLDPTSFEGRYERSNYIHPLYGLDGEVLTEDFPEDHRHHRGVFWTWHQVLIGDVRAGDPWLARGFSWKLENADVLPSGNGLRTTHAWYSPDFQNGEEPIVEERAEIVVHPAEGDRRNIDFDIQIRPLQDGVRLGGSEDDKGYGGFSLRVKMLEGLRFVAESGPLQPARGPLDAGDWVDFSAPFGATGALSGVAIMVHPASAGYPQHWILRSPETPSMQNPVWPGPDPVELSRQAPTRLRYRLVVHRGDASGVDLDELARAYVKLP